MRIVGPAGGKSRASRLFHPDGQIRFDTHSVPWKLYAAAGRNGMRRDDCANVIVEGRFVARDGVLFDCDTNHPYGLNRTGAMDVLQALSEGRLRMEDGCITGRFMFRSGMGGVHLVPAKQGGRGRRAVEAQEAEQAPDMTEFLKAYSAKS